MYQKNLNRGKMCEYEMLNGKIIYQTHFRINTYIVRLRRIYILVR